MGPSAFAAAVLLVLCAPAAAGAAPRRLRGSSSSEEPGADRAPATAAVVSSGVPGLDAKADLANETLNSTIDVTEDPTTEQWDVDSNMTQVHLPLTLVATVATSNASDSAGSTCMCLFDADRTLTGKQGRAGSCPGNQAVPGVYDDAHGGGDLTLSQLGATGLGATACGGCITGLVSAGTGGGQGKARLSAILRGGPMALGCQGPQKPSCARALAQRVGVPLQRVYFFDDMAANVLAFSGSGMNAHQVSCSSRDGGGLGLCGAQTWEIQLHSGVGGCR